MHQEAQANAAPAGRTTAAPSPGAMEEAAAIARACGECLLVIDRSGAVVCPGADVPPFCRDRLVPLLSKPDRASADAAARIAGMGVSSAPVVIDSIPGILLCAVPLVQRRQLRGVLVLAARPPAPSSAGTATAPDDGGALRERSAGDLVADALRLRGIIDDRARLAAMEGEIRSLSTQLANAYEELTLIERISGGMRVNRDIADFFHQTCLDVMQVMAVRAAGVAFCHEKCPPRPVLHGEIELDEARLARLAGDIMAALRHRGGYLLANNLADSVEHRWLAGAASQLLAVPLQRGEQLLGCFFALDKAGDEFNSVDAKLLASIAGESAVYLENALLFGGLHDLMMGLLHSLTSAVDAKDAYTCGHSERVALLSRQLAQRIGLPDAQVERIYMAGLLHDVGKIGVPENVLQKTGRLTSEEYELMKRHPQVGARILAEVKQLSDVVPAVLHHHERYDGRGYPSQLAGRDIPLAGRIICLADAFDAMTSNRTYRKALPLEVAMTEIRRCSGTQFDPALAEAFLEVPQETLRALLRDHETQARALLELQQTLRAA